MKLFYLKNFSNWLSKNLSKTAIFVSLALIAFFNVNYENWDKQYKVIAWDVNSYYAYLPMTFIYHDYDMDFMAEGGDKIKNHYWPLRTATGKKAIITTMGMSYLYAPFFLACHGIVQLTDYPGDEFSPPYKIALLISSFFYLIIGLIFLRKVLKKYFSDTVTAITLIMMVLGTNLLHYATDEPTMTHSYNFSLFSIFLYFLIRWLENPGWKNAVITGALAGLISLIRPSNTLIIILFVIWGVSSFKDLQDRVLFYIRRFHLLLIMILAFTLIWVPQFMYWHYTSGSIFFNSYGAAGGVFFLDQPQLCYTLFSYRKGWFLYTPVMLFAVIGLLALYKQHRKLFWPVLVYLVLFVYLISCWWCWWYGGGHGQRALVDFYPLMAIPLAALIGFLMSRKLAWKIPAIILLLALLYLNIFQTIQYRQGIIHNKMMTRISYWEVFMNMGWPSQRYWDNLVFPDYPGAKEGKYYTVFEIPYGLERQLGNMRARTYIDQLSDSLSRQPEVVQRLMDQDSSGTTPVDTLVYREAYRQFLDIKDAYLEEKGLKK